MFPSGILLQVPVISFEVLYHYTFVSACMMHYAYGTCALYNHTVMQIRTKVCGVCSLLWL